MPSTSKVKIALPDFSYFKTCSWQDPRDYQELVTFLRANSDIEYQHFNERLIPGSEGQTYGVRLSILRPLSKVIAQNPHFTSFLDHPKSDLYEEILLEGMVISQVKMTYTDRLPYINSFVPKITNWALCDCFVTSTMFKKHEADFWPELPRFLRGNPWSQRFAFCVMMTYYLDPPYLSQVFDFILTTPSDHYYVQMMQAWLLSVAFIKQKTATWEFLEQNKTNLPAELIKMIIRKIRDSFRVSPADKDLVLTLRAS